MRPIVWTVLLATFLSGCATSDQAVKSAESKYVGRPVEEFFAAKGRHSSSRDAGNSGKIYTWFGSTAPSSVQFQPKKGTGGLATGKPASEPRIGCSLELGVDA